MLSLAAATKLNAKAGDARAPWLLRCPPALAGPECHAGAVRLTATAVVTSLVSLI